MHIKNAVLDYVYEIQTVKLVWPYAKDRPRKAPLKNFGLVPT